MNFAIHGIFAILTIFAAFAANAKQSFGPPELPTSWEIPPGDPRYAKWIEMYGAPEFAELASWCRDLLDRLAARVADQVRQRIEDAFVTSSRYELAFWTQCWEYPAAGWR